MSLRQDLKRVLNDVAGYRYISAKDVQTVKSFLDSPKPLIRQLNTLHHTCVFFLPVHIPSRSVYLVDHIKAKDWIPPGGHIDEDESPVGTVRREFQEELSYRLTNEAVRPVQITVKHIRSKLHPCRTHFDFWYTVEMDRLHKFIYDVHEFHGAQWFSMPEGLRHMGLPYYRKALFDSVNYLFSH